MKNKKNGHIEPKTNIKATMKRVFTVVFSWLIIISYTMPIDYMVYADSSTDVPKQEIEQSESDGTDKNESEVLEKNEVLNQNEQNNKESEVLDKNEHNNDKPESETYTYDDDSVTISTTGVLPEKSKLNCEIIDEKSEEYLKLREAVCKLYNTTDDKVEIYPYNVGFIKNGKEVEPESSVNVKFEFKEPIQVEKKENTSVVHFENGNKPEIVAEDVETKKKIEEFEVELDSLSPVVLVKTNVQGSLRNVVNTTDEEGDQIFISKTPNVNADGTATSYYGNNQNLTDVVDLEGAKSVTVTIQYRTESTSYDWLYLKDSNDNIITEDADGKVVGDSTGKIGGGGSSNLTPSNTVTYRFEMDELKFVWRTDGSVVSYGYYAVCKPVFPETDLPPFHFEELEDGTYALVFDGGGDIEGFFNRKELKEQVSEYKNLVSEIRLHKETTSVTNGAFKDLPALSKVTMPRNSQLQTIGSSVFANCDNLKEITIPSSVTTLEKNIFKGSGIEKISFAPDSNVTTLPAGAFQNLTSLKDITLPENITAIPDDCFKGCTGLTEINIPENVTSIGARAFKGSGLKEINLEGNITSIGNEAFYGCTGLTEVSIPANVTSIGTSAFENCSNVTDFTFEDGTTFTTLPTKLFSGMSKLKNVTLPNGLTKLSNSLFLNCTSLQHVNLPDTVTRIDDYAFQGCTRLQDFDLPSSVTQLGTGVFKGCTSLKDMTIPASVTSIGTGLFADCNQLIKAEFEDGSRITTLPNEMFYGCTKLETVKLPDGVTAIPASYFRNCNSLKHVNLPTNLLSVGDYAFSGCYNLEDIPLNDGLKTIGKYAFYDCDKLTEVDIPKTVTSVGEYAWAECNGLTSVEFDQNSNLTSLGAYTFQNCKNLEELILPPKLKSIPSYMASGCTKLSQINIPSTVTNIGSYAFSSCKALEEVQLPNGLTGIDSYAFNSSGLKNIEFPSTLAYIGNYSFRYTYITDVTIPNKVTSVGSYAFAECQNLENVEFVPGGSACTIKTYAFYECPSLKTIDLKDEIKTIESYAFNNDKRITEIIIPKDTTSVGSYAFYNNQNATKLEFPYSSSALSIDSGNSGNSFTNLTKMEEILIDRDITSSYKNTSNFNGLNPEARITIGEHVNTLDNMIVSLFNKDREVSFSGENDFSVSTRVDNKSEDVKWQNLKGDFYVDANGVVYKLNNTNNTASVFHVPKGITEYTVPETITSVAGNTYTINKIESHAIRDAELTSLTITNPENVALPQFSLANCTSLMTVNGRSEIFPEEWADVSLLCGFPVHSDAETEQVAMIRDTTTVGEDESQAFSFGITVSGQESMDGLTYVYPTGMASRVDIAISNESNVDMSDRVIRIYFAFDGDNYTMGNYNPNQDYTLVNTATNSRYPFKVRSTDAQGVYYYDITGFKPGDTLAFNNNFAYISPKSSGGTLRIWAESLSSEDAARMDGKVSQPNRYIMSEWYTAPVEYNVTKEANSSQLQYTSNTENEDDENIYVKNIEYTIRMTSSGSSGNNYAKDYIKYVDFEDDLQLTENMMWNPKAIEAINNGDYNINSSNILKVKIDGKWVELFRMSFNNSSLVRNITPRIVTDENGNPAVKICWSYKNTYWSDPQTAPTADLPAIAHTIALSNQAIMVKQDSNLWKMLREGEKFSAEESEAMRKIANKVEETTHYSFSSPQTKVAETPQKLVYLTTGFTMNKTMEGDSYFGRKHEYVITMTNTGLIHKTDVDVIEDTMSTHYYITSNNLENMFKETKWGPYLHIDISSATLCEQPDKTAIDVYGHETAPLTAQQSGIEPIPYNGCASTDNSVITAKAKLALYWNTDRTQILLDIKNDEGIVQETKTIGENGDYTTIKEALDDIGYVVTRRAEYKVSWGLGDDYTLYNAHLNGVEAETFEDLTEEQIKQYEYKLKSGRTETFRIRSNVKDTTMMLEVDEPGYYPSDSLSTSNRAYAKDDTGTQVGSAYWSGYIYRELYLDKSAVVDGQTYTSNMKIPDNTVIGYNLSFTNNGITHEVLPLTDRMTGSQVLLAPVKGNKNALYYASGSTEGIEFQNSDLDIYNDGGVQYYILDKSGSYKNVTIDGRIADTVTVSVNNGVADTLMIWYFTNVTGNINGSSTSRSISYKALSSSSRLGATQTNPDGSTITAHALNNQTWLGGHQTHRLYDSVGGESEMIQFRKWIVENPEAQKENLITHSLIQSDDEVLYKIILRNTGDSNVKVTGNRIRDELPTTTGEFTWSDENIKDVYYVTEGLGSSVNYQDRDHWYIDAIQPGTGADTTSRGLYYIHWTEDFEIDFEPHGQVWIYVKTQYPGERSETSDEWDNYISKNNGAQTTNYFYVDQRQSSVTHELVDIVDAKLQKGVLETGLASSGHFQSEGTRDYYQNGTNTVGNSLQEVSYYTVIYNSGNVRLYLDPLRDQLPKGVKFRGLFNAIPKEAQTSSSFTTYTGGSSYRGEMGQYQSKSSVDRLEYYTNNSNYIPVATVQDGDKTVTYKNASISASVTTDSLGKEQITFTFGRYNNSDSYLKYDSQLNKYYLDPGEAIRFGYNCYVEGYKRTENIANNEIAMPVYDKYGLGVTIDENVTITPATYRDITPNDGGCELATTEEEQSGRQHEKSSWVRNTTQWLSSNVSLRRLDSVPGVQKSVGGETMVPTSVTIKPNEVYGSKYTDGAKGGTPYTGTIGRTSIANWKIRAYNEGGIGSNSMEDYWIVDTIDSPYMFTGNYFYDYYNVNGTKVTSSSVPIFSLGGRSENDTVVQISTGQGNNTLTLDSTIRVNGPAVTVDGGRAEVQLLRNAEGIETLRIHLIDPDHRIPPNTYMELYAHTQYVSSDAVLSKQFYNHVELQPSTEFDPALVSQGKVLYKDVDGEMTPYAIESGASVTMTVGYSSAARKQVTEIGNTSNTGWSDKTKNSILLPEKFSQFYYDLYVDLPEDDPTSKLVLIDSLPQENDHSPFVARDYRDSQFPVHVLSENPGFRVWSTPHLGSGTKTELTYDQYELDVSTKTEFEAVDWDGNGSGWTRINLSDGLSDEETTLLENARSFRIIIADPNVVQHPETALMGKDYQIQVRFNAEIYDTDEADPGEIAWNSFGYRYTVPIGATGLETSLNAEPLKVGVQISAVPKINKDLKTPDNHYKKADENSEYRFLIYSGNAIPSLNDISNMSLADIANVLSENSRKIMIKGITVESNSATAASGPLDEEVLWTYNNETGNFSPTTDHWIWQNNAKYTILELPWEENGFSFQDIQHNTINNYTFIQNNENNVSLRVTNVWNEKGKLSIEKHVNGPSADANRRFTFTISLHDGRYPVYGTYNYIGTNISDGTITFNDSGEASIQLKKDQKIEIQDIPAGYTYSVTESDDQLYTLTESSGEEGSISTGQVSESVFTNTRKDTTLSLSKTVRGGFGDKEKEFDFEIYVIDEGRELAGDFTGSITSENGASTPLTLTFVDGATTVQLKHGDTLSITGLPVGARYETDESESSRQGYICTHENASSVLTEQGVSASYINTMESTIPTGVKISRNILILSLIAFMFVIAYRIKKKN